MFGKSMLTENENFPRRLTFAKEFTKKANLKHKNKGKEREETHLSIFSRKNL
jgi:hypothetical protein